MVVRRIAIIAGLLIVLGAVGWGYRWSRSEWIEAGHVGVMYAARTGLEHRLYTPQRIFVPWFHQLYTYPTLTQAAIYTHHWHHVSLIRKILLRMRSWQNYVFLEGH